MYEDPTIKEYTASGQKRIIETVRSSLEYKTLRDIIISSDIIESGYETVDDPLSGVVKTDETRLQCTDDGEYSEDLDFINIYRELYSVTEDPFPEKFWSLRLSFTAKNLEYVDMSLFDISKLLEKYLGLEKNVGHGHKIICSDDNSDNLFIRIIIQERETKPDEIVSEQSYSVITLRKIEVFCMGIKLKGQEDIDRVFTRNAKVNQWSVEKGHHKDTQWILETEGSNLIGSMKIKGIDHTRTISNNILEINEVFGIEAARQALLNELRSVLSFDGSYVNYRHLSLLVDAMTCRGILTPMNRHGLNRNADIGALTKCSFEETVEILTDAAAFGDIDQLKGISDNIMLGQLIPGGTGAIDLFYDPDVRPDIVKENNEPDKYTQYSNILYVPSEPDYGPMAPFMVGSFIPSEPMYDQLCSM